MKSWQQFCEALMDRGAREQEHEMQVNGINNALRALGAVRNLVKSDPEVYNLVMKTLAALQGYQGGIAPFASNEKL